MCMEWTTGPNAKRVGTIRAGRVLQPQNSSSTKEVDVERCPFRPQRQKQEHHLLSDFVAHLILKKIGAREPRQGEIKFLAPNFYLLVNTHTPTQKTILQITLHFNVPSLFLDDSIFKYLKNAFMNRASAEVKGI
jgi:hypothetical protein